MVDPYQPPETEQNSPQNPQGLKFLAKVGLGLYLAPTFGLAITVVAMFSTLSANNSADPSALAEEISLALILSLIGPCLGVVGAIILGFCVLDGSLKTRRVFWFMMVISILYCFVVFPFGLSVGGLMIALLLVKREQFVPKSATSIGH